MASRSFAETLNPETPFSENSLTISQPGCCRRTRGNTVSAWEYHLSQPVPASKHGTGNKHAANQPLSFLTYTSLLLFLTIFGTVYMALFQFSRCISTPLLSHISSNSAKFYAFFAIFVRRISLIPRMASGFLWPEYRTVTLQPSTKIVCVCAVSCVDTHSEHCF